MHLLFIAVVLGIVEGLTEFLPVSSTGHLILAGRLLGFTGPKAASFEIFIQLGAILAVVVLYWPRFWGLLRPKPHFTFCGGRGLWLLFLTSLPAVIVGLLGHDYIKEHLFNPKSVAWALGVGAMALIFVEMLPRRKRFASIDDLTPLFALGVGLFQCLALWPGFSRAGATIMGGMILGAGRLVAAEYSFIAAAPIMVAATGYDLLKTLDSLSASDLGVFAVGFMVSFAAAWLAVKGFIKLLGRVPLTPFAIYRLIIAVAVWLLWPGSV